MYSIVIIDHAGEVTEYSRADYNKAVNKATAVYKYHDVAFVQVLSDETDRPVITLGVRPVDSVTRAKWAAWGIILVTALALTTLI